MANKVPFQRIKRDKFNCLQHDHNAKLLPQYIKFHYMQKKSLNPHENMPKPNFAFSLSHSCRR